MGRVRYRFKAYEMGFTVYYVWGFTNNSVIVKSSFKAESNGNFSVWTQIAVTLTLSYESGDIVYRKVHFVSFKAITHSTHLVQWLVQNECARAKIAQYMAIPINFLQIPQ